MCRVPCAPTVRAAEAPARALPPTPPRCPHLAQAVALVLMEVFAAGTATSAAGALPRATLTRLMFDIYDNDVDALRSYCTTDPELEGLVGFLDQNDRAGWDFVEQLLRGKKTSGEMRLHRFVAL